MITYVAALLLLAICATGSQQRDRRAGGAFAPASATGSIGTIATLITRFSASAAARQVYAVAGPEGKERKAVGDSPIGRKGEPLAVVRDECHGDGASSCKAVQVNAVGVLRKGSLPEGPRQTAPPFGLVA